MHLLRENATLPLPFLFPDDRKEPMKIRLIHALVLVWFFGLYAMLARAQSGKPVGNVPFARNADHEDWTTPTLRKGTLKPQPPLVAAKQETDSFIRELVHLQWRSGDPINIYIIKPKNQTKPPVALYLYSYPQDALRFTNDDYCQRLVSNGCAAVGFESALTGDRYRLRPMKEWFISELQESLACSAHDVPLLLDYLASRGDLDTTRVGMFGQGSGAAIAILAAACDPRIQTLDLLHPWGDWEHWLAKSPLIPEKERPLLVTDAFLKKVGNLEPCRYLPRLKDRRIRLQILKDEPSVPDECLESLVKAIPENALVIRFDSKLQMASALSGGRLFAWLGQQLHSPRAPHPSPGTADAPQTTP